MKGYKLTYPDGNYFGGYYISQKMQAFVDEHDKRTIARYRQAPTEEEQRLWEKRSYRAMLIRDAIKRSKAQS